MRIKLIATLSLLACLALTVPAGTIWGANSDKKGSGKETFSALAYLPAGIGPSMRGAGATADVTINIDGYSSDQDARQLQAILLEGGPNALLKTLEKMKTIGRIERVGTISFYEFKFISSTPTATGRRIFALTDRPIGFLEAYLASRSTDYKFGILQLDLKDDKKGREEGVGTLIYAGQIKVLNGNNVEIENFGVEPIRLEGVRQL